MSPIFRVRTKFILERSDDGGKTWKAIGTFKDASEAGDALRSEVTDTKDVLEPEDTSIDLIEVLDPDNSNKKD